MDQPAKLPTTARGLDIFYREFRAEIQRRNAAAAHPLPLCKECLMPIGDGEEDWLFPARCTTCAINRLEKMVWRISRRIGRKRTVRALHALVYRD